MTERLTHIPEAGTQLAVRGSFFFLDIVRSDVALDKQKGCKIAQHPDVMLELQREKAAQMHLVLLKEQFSNTYSNLILTGKGIGVGWNLRAL